MRYAVCLESDTGGWSMAHVPDLPGCYATADDPWTALQALLPAIPAYWAWLRRHGAPAPGPADLGEVSLGVIETVRSDTPAPRALFEYEVAPLSRQAVAGCLERLTYTRRDLLDLVSDLPAAMLAPGPAETVGGILAHLAATEQAYTRLVAPETRVQSGGSPLDRLAIVRAAAVQHISSLPDDDYGRIFLHAGERWNVRKLLRRMLEHEREHTAQIAGLLGVTLPESGAVDLQACG
jgi:predicted RNase H-like HicB family nuclease